jgi:TolB-like protein/DNA-binding winged helix-turn-helix (wHTH) protein/Tfp pilus assembly protein PilF
MFPMPSSAHESATAPGINPRRVAFDRFELDPRSGELRKDGRRIRLQAQPFRLLELLIANAGEVVTRDEVCRVLWHTDTFVDFDHSVASALNKIREALGDSAEKPRFIETLPRRGYRFIAPVKLETLESSPPNQALSRFHGRRAKVLAFATVVVAVALLVAVSFSSVRERLLGRHHPPSIQSLAVLPLADLSGHADQEYFADGMTEALITDLGKISALRVISRTSVMQYKGTKKSLPEIARELNVDALVEGTVSRSGSHLRITASLVQASPEKHLWAESYKSEVGDALAIQGEIARAVAREIQLRLTQKEQNLLAVTRVINPEAQDLYLRGLYTYHARDTAEAERAINYFQRAVQKDPNYAAAYAGLAEVYATWIPGMPRPREQMPKAKEFALKALSLDDTLAEAHSELGVIELSYDWNWFAAEQEFKRTMELNPNHVWTHTWHARALVTSGQTDQAIAEAKLSISLDPSPLSWDYPVWIFVMAHRYDLALERAQELLEFAPNYSWGHFELAQIYEQTGRPDDAAQEYLKADELFGTDPKRVARLQEAFATSGARGYWRQTLEDYKESAKSAYVPSVLVAEACIRVADKECAFQWLEKGFEERDDLMINLKVEPVFDEIRSDPRFQDLVRRVGLPQ